MTLLEGSKAKIEFGKNSTVVKVDSGIKQGCPLSPYLYAIATIPLINKINADTRILGLQIGTTIIKTSFYADDAQIFPENEYDLRRILKQFTRYEKAANQVINYNKSKLLHLNSEFESEKLHIIKTEDSECFLGYNIGLSEPDNWKKNYFRNTRSL